MEVINNENIKEIIYENTGVGLGNFDGLHIGHMALINTLICESKLNGYKSLVYTFTKHPEHILRKKLFKHLITKESKKVELLGETCLNYLFFDEFDEAYSRMTPEAFVKNILVEKLKIKLAVTGFNYRFGFKGSGDVTLLKELGKKYNFKVIEIPPIKIDNEVVSSTLIREYVKKGSMDKVFKLLGRHYSLTGKVQSGRKIGRKIGFPTANIIPEEYLQIPFDGVYITKTLLNGKVYSSITNIGKNPTFEGQNHVTIETHILDFDEDIYSEDIEVFFISKIRGEKKFSGVDELIIEIKSDIIKTREYFNFI